MDRTCRPLNSYQSGKLWILAQSRTLITLLEQGFQMHEFSGVKDAVIVPQISFLVNFR
jgi:hypothetical protein